MILSLRVLILTQLELADLLSIKIKNAEPKSQVSHKLYETISITKKHDKIDAFIGKFDIL